MLWTEIRSWAKTLGYDTIKDKDDGKYYWAKLDDTNPDNSGVASSVSKLAKAIYNHHTNNQWLDHQKEFENNLNDATITLTDYESQ